jgi:hypothetical protein
MRVTIATTGGGLDGAYRVNVSGFGFQDGAPANGSVTFYYVPPREYSVELQDIASNCAVSGANPQAITVTDYATAELAFAVTCSSATNGSIRVTGGTTGEDLDPTGYFLYLNWTYDGLLHVLPANGSLMLPGLEPGEYGFSVGDVASNCAVIGENFRTVTVSAGATSDVAFAVTCAGNLPSMRVTIATTGTDVDPDGYWLFVPYTYAEVSCRQTSWQCGRVPVNGSFTVSGVAPTFFPDEEPFLVALSDVAANCAVIGGNPQTVRIVQGATAEVVFAVTCGRVPSLRVTTATTGGDLDPDGYRVNVSGVGFQDPVPVNGSVSFYEVSPGQYSVELQGIAPNCAVSGVNPQPVTVTDGATRVVSFAIACSSNLVGSVRVTTVASGEAVDPGGYYTVRLIGYVPDGYIGVPANGFFTYVAVLPGSYSVELSNVAPNCTVSGANPRPVTVTIGATADAVFVVKCSSP